MSDAESGDVLLYQLYRQRASMFEAVRDYEQRLEGRVEQARGLEAEVNAQRARYAAAEGELRTEIERLRHEGEALTAENGRLAAGNDALQATIDEIMGSRSWRTTRPLRAIGRLGAPETTAE